MSSYIRNCRVSLATRADKIAKRKDGSRFRKFTEKVVVEGLRVVFKIDKDLSNTANQAEITIYNLAHANRSAFATKPGRVYLEVGYGSNYEKIYEGDIISTTSKIEGTEWATRVVLGTGIDAKKNARTNRTFKIGAGVLDVAESIVADLGSQIPTTYEELEEFDTEGLTISMPSSDALTNVLKPHGYTWSNQDGKIQILKGQRTLTIPSVQINEESGMIGSPSITEPEKSKGPKGVSVKIILDSSIIPGQAMTIKSRDISGNFKVLSVKHSGDNFSDTWYSDIEGVQV